MIRRVRIFVLLVFVLSACNLSNAPTAEPAGTMQPSPTPLPPEVRIPEGGTLTVRLAQDLPTLQPWAPQTHEAEQIVDLMYRSLIQLDTTLIPQPELAQVWESDASGTILTMTLRTDVEWHDGTPLTAADAAWTLASLQDISPTTTLLADIQQVIVAVEAPTSSTLVLQLREPYAPLLASLSTPILPQHIWGSFSPEQLASMDFWQNPVGSGPFMFEERQPEQVIALVRNPEDAIQVPFLDRVAFVVAPDPAVASDALLQQELLAAELPWNTASSLINSPTAQDILQLGTYPENGWYFLGFNTRPGRPFSDVRVRQALAALVTPQMIVEELGTRALPISSDHLPGTWTATAGPEAEKKPQLQKARELLTSAGWIVPEGSTIRASNGITLSMPLYVRGDDERRIRVAERIASTAREVGIDLQVTPADFETVIRPKLVAPFDFDIGLMSWSNSRVFPGSPSYAAYDPDNFALFHSSQIYQGAADSRPGLRNFVAFEDDSFDNLTMAARALYDTQRRQDLYQQTSAIIAEQVPYIFLWADQIPVALNQQVRSVQGEINLNTPMWLQAAPYWYLAEE